MLVFSFFHAMKKSKFEQILSENDNILFAVQQSEQKCLIKPVEMYNLSLKIRH